MIEVWEGAGAWYPVAQYILYGFLGCMGIYSFSLLKRNKKK